MILNLGHSLTDVPRLCEADFLQQLVTTVMKQCYHLAVPVKIENSHIYKYRYHKPESFALVIGCKLSWQTGDKKIRLRLFIGAASNNTKLIAYHNIHWLREHGFDSGALQVIKPVVYLEDFKALVYEASEGQTLYWHLKKSPVVEDLQQPLQLAAQWLLKLHRTPATNLPETMKENNDLEMVKSLERTREKYAAFSPEQGDKITRLLEMIRRDIPTVNHTSTLTYGDFHPENIILQTLKTKKLCMIDLSDIAMGDPYRDVGTFVQQFDFMSQNFLDRQDINKLKRYFVEQYTGLSFEAIPLDYIRRINLYQALTAVRSSVWLFEPESRQVSLELLDDARLLIEKVDSSQRSINLH